MPSIIPFFKIEKEQPSQLYLASADRRWMIIILVMLLITPLMCLSGLALIEEEIRLVGIGGIAIGLFIYALILFIVPIKTQFIINLSMRTVTLNRFYLLGSKIRDNEWTFNEITDVNILDQGLASRIEFDINGKKAHRLNFGRKGKEAQRAYNVLQSWLKGLTLDSDEATIALQEITDDKKLQQSLKNAQKLLYYFGGFSLLAGLMSFSAENTLNSSISTATIVSLSTGLIYLACGYGAKRKIEAAIWVAIFIVIAERLYWFIISGSLSGEGNWSSWVTWIFAFFVVSSLWQAIRSIRSMEEEQSAFETVM